MPNAAVNELIQMYSSGIISRGGLERELSLWEAGAGTSGQRAADPARASNYVTLVPDAAGVWRLAA